MTCLHFGCTTGGTSQKIEATGEVMCSRSRPTDGCSFVEEDDEEEHCENFILIALECNYSHTYIKLENCLSLVALSFPSR